VERLRVKLKSAESLNKSLGSTITSGEEEIDQYKRLHLSASNNILELRTDKSVAISFLSRRIDSNRLLVRGNGKPMLYEKVKLKRSLKKDAKPRSQRL